MLSCACADRFNGGILSQLLELRSNPSSQIAFERESVESPGAKETVREYIERYVHVRSLR